MSAEIRFKSRGQLRITIKNTYEINCIIPLLEFINTHGSITDGKKLEVQTDEVAALANSQSQSRSMNKI